MAAKKDQFLEYAKIQDEGFLCAFCQHYFCGSVSVAMLQSHLAGERCSDDTKVCDKVPNDVQLAALQAIHASEMKGKSKEIPFSAKECAPPFSHPSSSMVKGLHQSTMPKKICKKKDKCLVDRKLAKFILSNGLPISFIRSPSFIDLAKALAEFGPGYELPNRLDSILDFKAEVAKYMVEVKKHLAETGCTLIVDQWGDYYCDEETCNINIFVYTPKGLILEDSFRAPSFLGRPDSVFRTVDYLGPEHVKQCFVEEAVEFPPLLKYPEISTTCASVKIEGLLIELFEVEWIYKTCWLTKLIVTHIKEHDVNLPSTRVYYRRSKEYNNSDLTDYSSIFLMLQSVLKHKKELQALHVYVPFVDDTEDLYSSTINCNEFWREGIEVVQVLQPIFQLLNLVDGYMSTSGYLYEAFKRAKDKIEKCLNANQNKYELISEEFERCRKKTIQPIHKAAALLNPYYNLSEDLNDNEIEEGKGYILEKLVAPEEKEVFTSQFEGYLKTQRPQFRNKTMNTEVHPRIWWERYGDSFPVLRKYAIQILSQPCSMLSCHQYRVDHICYHDNYQSGVNTMLMEKYSMLEAGDEEPIDLDKLSGSPEQHADPDNQDFDIDDSVSRVNRLNINDDGYLEEV